VGGKCGQVFQGERPIVPRDRDRCGTALKRRVANHRCVTVHRATPGTHRRSNRRILAGARPTPSSSAAGCAAGPIHAPKEPATLVIKTGYPPPDRQKKQTLARSKRSCIRFVAHGFGFRWQNPLGECAGAWMCRGAGLGCGRGPGPGAYPPVNAVAKQAHSRKALFFDLLGGACVE